MLPHTLNHTLTTLENNPEYSGSGSVALVFLAHALKLVVDDRINPLFMDITQWCAWAIGILVGICSLVGFTKRFINWLHAYKNGGPTKT